MKKRQDIAMFILTEIEKGSTDPLLKYRNTEDFILSVDTFNELKEHLIKKGNQGYSVTKAGRDIMDGTESIKNYI